MSQKNKLRVENVTKIFGDQPEQALRQLEAGVPKDEIYRTTRSVAAVANVSFEVGQGEIFVVMGLSGSGKSTLIRCLNRLIEPTSGHVFLDGDDLLAADARSLREIRRTKLGMVFQHFALMPHRTVGQNTEYSLKIRGIDRATRRQAALKALEQVGLREWADSMPQQLSGGMQQRVGLARALAADPELLLMDEPFSALDPLIRRDMQQELLQLQRHMHKTIIFITHDLNEALILGDRIAIMKDGQFVQLGTAEDIVSQPATDYVAAFTQDVDRGRVFRLGSIMHDPQSLPAASDLATARERLQQVTDGALYVVDGEQRPQGLITAAALDGVGRGSLQDYLRTDFPSADCDTHLSDVYSQCAAGVPIAVLDGGGRLCGVVEPAQVFAKLAGGQVTESAASDTTAR